MSDFTPAQARKWVAQEAAKHTTPDEIRQRIATERKQAEDPIMKKISADFPNSTKAHLDLIGALEAKLQ
jgi:hypothetical protein